MKYIYKNVTLTNQNVLLASKNQDTVGVRTFSPGATLELDYPGLNLYVPSILSCMIIGDEQSVIPIVETPIVQLAPVVVLPTPKLEESIPVLVVPPILKAEPAPKPISVVVPPVPKAVTISKSEIAKEKTTKKTKK